MEIMSSTLAHSCKSSAICNCGKVAEEIAAVSEDERERKRRRRRTVSRELPEDVITEVLLRLPIKSLIRFKSVCKSWYDLILSPNFITMHDSSNLKKKVSIFCNSYKIYKSPTTISVRFFDVSLELKFPYPVVNVKLVGCCNGIVCLSLFSPHHKFALWNPATNQSRLISTQHPIRNAKHTYSGFCFDSVVNTYKVARLSFFHKDNHKLEVPEGRTVCVILHVLTLIDNSWKEKKLFAPCRVREVGVMNDVTYINRCMYWIVSGEFILCFDMVDEVFKLIDLPCDDHIYRVTEIVDYKGCLAMFVWEDSTTCFEMWVLNDCGGTSWSWCKQLALRPPGGRDLRPIRFLNNGEVNFGVLSTNNQCLLWDTDSGEITETFYGYRSIYPFFLYSESFASVY